MLPATREQYEIAISPESVAHRAYAFKVERAVVDVVRDEGIAIDEIELPTIHHFQDDIYLREMRAPTGAIIVGLIHKHAHFVIVSAGCIVLSMEGGRHQAIRAPATFISQPGAKRIGMVAEDTVWTTIHKLPRADMRDIEEIEREIFCNDESEFFEFAQMRLAS